MEDTNVTPETTLTVALRLVGKCLAQELSSTVAGQLTDAVNEAMVNADFVREDAVRTIASQEAERAMEDIDVEAEVQGALENFTFIRNVESIVEEAVNNLDVERMVEEALNDKESDIERMVESLVEDRIGATIELALAEFATKLKITVEE